MCLSPCVSLCLCFPQRGPSDGSGRSVVVLVATTLLGLVVRCDGIVVALVASLLVPSRPPFSILCLSFPDDGHHLGRILNRTSVLARFCRAAKGTTVCPYSCWTPHLIILDMYGQEHKTTNVGVSLRCVASCRVECCCCCRSTSTLRSGGACEFFGPGRR